MRYLTRGAGTPSLDELHAIASSRSGAYIRSLPIRVRVPFSTHFPDASANAIEFLSKTLTVDPQKRLTVDGALEHPYLAAYVSTPTFPPLTQSYFQFDLCKDELSKQQLKELLYEEVLSFERKC
ncbi:Mapk1 protein [Mycena leptocephala]|nr:Mapk1 protein [Mycena leptocephala]